MNPKAVLFTIATTSFLVASGIAAWNVDTPPNTDQAGHQEIDEQAAGSLFPATSLNQTAVFLTVNNTREVDVEVEVKFDDLELHAGTWTQHIEVFSPTGAKTSGGFLGVLDIWDHEPLIVTHEGERHAFGPRASPLVDEVFEPLSPRGTDVDLEPGLNHILIGLVNFEAIVSVKAPEGHENQLLLIDEVEDPGLVRWRHSMVEGDWDEVSFDVWVAYTGWMATDASTREEFKHSRNWLVLCCGGNYGEFEVTDSEGVTCRSEGVDTSGIFRYDLPPGPVDIRAFAVTQAGQSFMAPHFHIYDLPLPPIDAEQPCST